MCFPPRRCMEKSGFKLIDPHTGNFIANVIMHKTLQKTPWFQKHINFPGDGAKISFLRSLQQDFNQNECECLTIALSSLSRTQEIHVLEKSSYTLCKIVHNKIKSNEIPEYNKIDVEIIYLQLHKNSQIAWVVITPTNKLQSLEIFFLMMSDFKTKT